ncbi:MAG: zinc-ribbon domain-containing protein [Actinobacteria bacterium]|nr:zinc-ribbon domain-containing protein [Actinomycetota bacterium]
MLVCASCGHENSEGAKFCEECGFSFAPSPVRAREQRKTVTVLFCDLTGSTALGETLDPERLRALLARYFEAMKGDRRAPRRQRREVHRRRRDGRLRRADGARGRCSARAALRARDAGRSAPARPRGEVPRCPLERRPRATARSAAAGSLVRVASRGRGGRGSSPGSASSLSLHNASTTSPLVASSVGHVHAER